MHGASRVEVTVLRFGDNDDAPILGLDNVVT
jgi:hypothetical protein